MTPVFHSPKCPFITQGFEPSWAIHLFNKRCLIVKCGYCLMGFAQYRIEPDGTLTAEEIELRLLREFHRHKHRATALKRYRLWKDMRREYLKATLGEDSP